MRARDLFSATLTALTGATFAVIASFASVASAAEPPGRPYLVCARGWAPSCYIVYASDMQGERAYWRCHCMPV